jgi:hypothetical protein
MMDILCLSTTDWDEIWGSRQQIMLKLAENGHRILFVERQVSPEQLLRAPGIFKRKRYPIRHPQKFRQVKENIWLFTPPMVFPGRYYSHVLNRMGQRKIAQALCRPISNLGYEDYILWIYPPQSSPIINLLNLKSWFTIVLIASLQVKEVRKD